MKRRVVAIIPARGGSKGIPRKNLALVLGKPLVGIAVEQALAASLVTEVWVSSEDAEIRETGSKFGARAILRPEEFIHDNTFQEVDRLLMWTVKALEGQSERIDVVVLVYPTAPLRRSSDIDEAVRLIFEEGYDSSLSVYEDPTYLWSKTQKGMQPVNYDPAQRGPRQREGWNQWAENKAVYAMKRDLLMDTGCRLGGRVGAVVMPKLLSVDVDSPGDLELVRLIAEKGLGT